MHPTPFASGRQLELAVSRVRLGKLHLPMHGRAQFGSGSEGVRWQKLEANKTVEGLHCELLGLCSKQAANTCKLSTQYHIGHSA